MALALAFGFWLIGGPQQIWRELFPTQFYDNVEVKLVIDGEAVTVTGTVFCSISHRSVPYVAYRGSTVTRTGGAAATVMSDGRAVVIPYSDLEYCHRPVAADGRRDRDHKDWWSVFDRHFSLKGNINILIMDDGDNPTAMELIVGPGYFQNPEASIKLISADRWRSKRGRATVSELHWIATGRGLDRVGSEREKWAGAFAYEIQMDQPNPVVEQIGKIVAVEDEADLSRAIRPLRELVERSDSIKAWAIRQSADTVELEPVAEPFRIPLVHLNPEGRKAEVQAEHSAIFQRGCPVVWAAMNFPDNMIFYRAGNLIEITALPMVPYLLEEEDREVFFFVNTICVASAAFY